MRSEPIREKFEGKEYVVGFMPASFTDEERQSLREAILFHRPDIDQRKTEAFIASAERCCEMMLSVFLSRTKNADITENRREMLNALKSAAKSLENLYRCKGPDVFFNTVSHFDFYHRHPRKIREDIGRELVDLIKSARKAVEPIERMIEILEKWQKEDLARKRKRGDRPRADEYGFCKSLAISYRNNLGIEPTGSTTGLFYDLVKICLKVVGLSNDYPYRKVKQAFDSLRTETPNTG